MTTVETLANLIKTESKVIETEQSPEVAWDDTDYNIQTTSSHSNGTVLDIRDKKSTEVLTDTVGHLAGLAVDAVSDYRKNLSKFTALQDKVFSTLLSDSVQDNLENGELIKLLELTAKNQLAPIEQLTKLTTQIIAIQERIEKDRGTQAILDIKDNLEKAQAKVELEIINATESDDETNIKEIVIE